MKHVLSSQKAFECHATIDYCYFVIAMTMKEMSKSQSGLEKMIDDATGFGEAQNKKRIGTVIKMLREIIKCKKKIECDHSVDSNALDELMKLKEKPKTA